MSNTKPPFDNHKPQVHHDNALLRLLVDEAIRRGDTLQVLAEKLGVTYSRLTQWRRKEADIKNAHRNVTTQAASYLKLPVVVVLLLAEVITLSDFVWPSEESIDGQLVRALDNMRQDPLVAGLIPLELASAPQAVRVLVAFLYTELRNMQRTSSSAQTWLSILGNAKLVGEQMLSASPDEKNRPRNIKSIF